VRRKPVAPSALLVFLGRINVPKGSEYPSDRQKLMDRERAMDLIGNLYFRKMHPREVVGIVTEEFELPPDKNEELRKAFDLMLNRYARGEVYAFFRDAHVFEPENAREFILELDQREQDRKEQKVVE